MTDWPHEHWVLFCDDVRQEVGNKASYMGVYDIDIHFQVPEGRPVPPLERIAIVMFLRWPRGTTPRAEVAVRSAGESATPFVEVPHGPARPSDVLNWDHHNIIFQLGNIPFTPGRSIEAVIRIDGEERVLGSLLMVLNRTTPPPTA
jgi:hypothetical protein